MFRQPSPKLLMASVIVGAGLLVGAGAIGWAIGDETSPSATTSAQAPSGHVGGNLPVAEIGDPAKGRMLFVEKRCAQCHMYLGKGGTDAPPLDFMRGHLSATEIANMSGRIWDHLPFMLDAFKEEGVPVPSFTGNEMANLIAYLHSGVGGAPAVKPGEAMGGGGGAMGPAQKGKRTFINAGCGGCHTFSPAGTKATVGPNLDSSLKGKDAAFVQESIVDPDKVIAKGYQNVMPSSYGKTLSKQQLADLVAFLLQK